MVEDLGLVCNISMPAPFKKEINFFPLEQTFLETKPWDSLAWALVKC